MKRGGKGHKKQHTPSLERRGAHGVRTTKEAYQGDRKLNSASGLLQQAGDGKIEQKGSKGPSTKLSRSKGRIWEKNGLRKLLSENRKRSPGKKGQ